MSAVTDVVVPLVVGLGAGTFASLTAPWAQWGVEKRRERRRNQTAVITGARALVAERQDASRKEILVDPRYLAIRPHLTADVEKELRRQGLVAVADTYGTVGNYWLRLIRDEGRSPRNRVEADVGRQLGCGVIGSDRARATDHDR